MGNLLEKLGHFFETHVEKIVLAVAGLLGLWLIVIRVLLSPNVVEFDNKTFSPKAIDDYLVEFAIPVKNRLAGPADGTSAHVRPWDEPVGPDDPVREGITGDLQEGFLGLFAGPLQHVSSAFYPPLPRHGSGEALERREYALPVIDDVSDILVGHIRAAAYFPVEELSDENTYENGRHEPNDLDLVTVQGTFNVSLLRDRFYDSFAGEDLPEPWRDEMLAEPVFATVNLQRQKQGEDGAWGPWTDVPRLAIEYRDELMHVITKAEDLPPGGIRIRALELKDEEIRTALLQPPAYDIASAHEDWFPPSLHDEFLDTRKKEIAYEKREERRAEKKSHTSERSNIREQRRAQGGMVGMGGQGGMMAGGRGGGADLGGMYGGAEGGTRRTRSRSRSGNATFEPGGGTGQPRSRGGSRSGRGGRGESELYYEMMGETPGRTARRNQPTVDDVYAKLDELMLSPFKEFSDIDEVTFWAHDDRLEPGRTYRYRVRIGVLNPVAGTGNVRDADIARADDVILWSPFSDKTSRVYVPYRLRFFAKAYKAATDQVTVEVAKFDMGYWNMETFSVKPGERIGREMEVEEEEDPLVRGMDPARARMMRMEAQMYENPFGLNLEPQTIDYSTGAVLVGAARVDGWTQGAHLRAQISHDMLYTTDGVLIERAPIASASWTDDIASSYRRIKLLEREPREDFRGFGTSPAKRGRTGRGGSGDRGGLYGEMMMGY
ncbi:MAG: hypothetical protein IIC50_04785 [Planctomycetes bacterium]|nr:hypothetical protein [Planctomycetota bacterium]